MNGFNLYQYAPNPIAWIDPWGWVKGGSYYQVSGSNMGGEVNYMAAYSAYKGLSGSPSRSSGPAIWMEKADHRQTASWASSNAAKAYRARQSQYIRGGNWVKAIEMDIRDIQSKFGSKYNGSIKEMLTYANKRGLITNSQRRRLGGKCR